jgi:dethiobiotin synthetase
MHLELFVTGTDIGVGKTLVTSLLAEAALRKGWPLRAVKPLSTGAPPPGKDATRLAAAAGHEPQFYACLEAPTSPSRAARMAGIELNVPAIIAWIRDLPRPRIVEGVGGWAVPLSPGWRVDDMAAALGSPVVLVAAGRPGVVSHALLTVEAVKARGLEVRGVVLHQPFPTSATHARWNLEDLTEALAPVPVVALEPDPSPADGDALLELLWPELAFGRADDHEVTERFNRGGANPSGSLDIGQVPIRPPR